MEENPFKVVRTYCSTHQNSPMLCNIASTAADRSFVLYQYTNMLILHYGLTDFSDDKRCY